MRTLLFISLLLPSSHIRKTVKDITVTVALYLNYISTQMIYRLDEPKPIKVTVGKQTVALQTS